MAQENKTFLQQKLIKLKREAEEREAQRIAQKFGLPYIDLSKAPVQIVALGLIDEAGAKDAMFAALERKRDNVAVAVVDPDKKETKAILKKLERQNLKIKLFVGSLSGLKHVWSFYKFVPKKETEITGRVDIEKKELEELRKKIKGLAALKKELEKFDYKKRSTAELFETILAGALSSRASDIHFEAETDHVKFRLRVDGVLHDIFNLDSQEYGFLLSRVKLLSKLKLNVVTEAQDGRFTIRADENEIEIRTSVIPSEYGETVVMRVLDPAAIQLTLVDLGLRNDDLEIAKREFSKPNGMILNTGQTGSGKTTTLYAFLRTVNKPEIKVITIEDPIEYHLEGIEQTQVDPAAGYSFVNGLRSILRQDPDVILVGEVRDLETAEIAMHAALTGHLVFSTLHTNDAVGAIPRLVDLGVRPSIIGPALNLVIAQRLLRRLCDECKKPVKMDAAFQKKVSTFLSKMPPRVDGRQYEKATIYEAVGCDRCGDMGYKGRIGVFELLEVDKELEELVYKEATEAAIKRVADKRGMVTMQADGILKVLSGITDFKEVERVTGKIIDLWVSSRPFGSE
ncbi:MAG: hypothetical protein UX23_C0012G0020 [Parcubacteria group bacterium GW2011_GWB1_45_9]|nr:MAG: hypothetical protein UX23_C0012G0020 [Parcubacteria group bacterium GW2011_GWB1_45_9]